MKFTKKTDKVSFVSMNLRIDQIRANPYQHRKSSNSQALEELADSIRVHGVLQPVLVRKLEEGYQLVSGERRVKAAKIAGLTHVPVVVREMTDQEAAAATLVENLQREDVSFLDEAAGFQKLNHEFGLTQTEIAKLVGKSQSYIANKIRILSLSPEIREIISREIILTERHCRALLRLPDEAAQMEIVNEILKKKLTTQQTDEKVEKIVNQDVFGKTGQKRRMVIKDIRIFLNSIKGAIAALHATGIETDWEQNEDGEFYEFKIKVKKHPGSP